MTIAERTLPHNLEAERSVLGAVLLSDKALADAPYPGEFFRDAHRRIAESMRRLSESGVAIDLTTLRAELDRRGDLDEVGGPAYIAALVDGVPHSTNVKHYTGIVREKSRLREIIFASNKTLAAAYEGEETADAIAQRAALAIAAAAPPIGRGLVSADDSMTAYMFALDEEKDQPFMTGYYDLDTLIGGLRPKSLAIVAARPSVGKSSFGFGLADSVARSGLATAYFSPEMTCGELSALQLAWHSGVPSSHVERKTATHEEWAAVSTAVGRIAGLPLYIDDGPQTIYDLIAACQKLKRERDLKLVIIDYLQLLAPDRAGRSREEEISTIVAALKQQIAKALGVCVVALSQLNRGPEDRRDKRPHLSDLRESGALEQFADLAILLFREEMHRPKPENDGVAEVIVAKNRGGPVGPVRMAFLKHLAQFQNLSNGV